MGQNRVDEVEYRRRLNQLMSHWGVSETAILMYARRNGIDIAANPWEEGFRVMTMRHMLVGDTQTRRVGNGYLGAERAPGEVGAQPTNVQQVKVAGPVEPNARQLQLWSIRLKAEAFLSKIFGREIKITII